MAKARKLVLLGDTLLTLFQQMALLRCCEEQIVELIRGGQASPTIRPLYGLEAVAAGLTWRLRDDDLLFGPDYARSLAVAKGVLPRQLFRSFLKRAPAGRATDGDSYRARFDASGFVGAGALAKPSLRQAAGAALGFKLQQRDSLAAVVFPASLIGSGAFHEAVRLAQSESLAVLFVCDHRIPATAPPAERLSLRVRAYGLPCVFVEANDLTEVYAAVSDAVKRARTEGPCFLECAVECLDPMQFGSAEMEQTALQEWSSKDPLSIVHDLLAEHYATPLANLNRTMAAAHQEVVEAIAAARTSGGQ